MSDCPECNRIVDLKARLAVVQAVIEVKVQTLQEYLLERAKLEEQIKELSS